jgi:hypothetical protein
MALKLLTLENLTDLDFGKARNAFDKELRRCVEDCLDRPNDEAARTVTLQLTLKPVSSGQECEACKGEFEIKSKVPVRRTRSYHFGVKTTGQLKGNLYFSEDSPDNFDQATFFDGEGKDVNSE